MQSDFALIANHLWQTTLFAGLVALACVALRGNHARVRYWLWLAASVKFLVPFTLLVSLGTRVEVPYTTPAATAVAVTQVSASFAPAEEYATAPRRPAGAQTWLARGLMAVWACGTLLLLAHWMRRWFALRAVARKAQPFPIPSPVRVALAETRLEPGVFGLFRPVLLMPAELATRLTPKQFQAILAHELCHVRHRDNLTAAIHMGVQSLFWFHPLVWWIGGKLVDERENACDETVLHQGNAAEEYAQSILNVCRFYVESPLPCTAGVTGSDLKKRIRQILSRRVSRRLSLPGKAILAGAGLAVLILPLAIGVLRSQTLPPAPAHTYEVVSIRPAEPGNPNSRIGPGPQGGLRAQNTSILQLLTFAYDVREFQFADVPGWVRSERFDVSFTPDKPEVQPGPGMARDVVEGLFKRHRQRMQAVLRDRCGLVLRSENREMPIYALTLAKGGHKLKAVETPVSGPHMRNSRSELSGTGIYLDMLATSLSSQVGRPVKNETGLDGPFDFKLTWTPDAAAPVGPPGGGPPERVSVDDTGLGSLFTALTEQLGLRLESKRGSAQTYVIEKIDRPTAN